MRHDDPDLPPPPPEDVIPCGLVAALAALGLLGALVLLLARHLAP